MNEFQDAQPGTPWRGERGIRWCAGWFGLLAGVAVVSGVLAGGVTLLFTLLLAGVQVYAALGLLRTRKPAWHLATFLAFAAIVLNGIAIACAPGAIADGESTLLEAAIRIVVLAVSLHVYWYLRQPQIRTLYGVPLSYRVEDE